MDSIQTAGVGVITSIGYSFQYVFGRVYYLHKAKTKSIDAAVASFGHYAVEKEKRRFISYKEVIGPGAI